MIRRLAIVGAALVLALPAAAAEIHGQSDVFQSPEVKLAWAIERGPDEARTFVIVRMQASPTIKRLVVRASDPFTKAQKVLQRAVPGKGRIEVRIARSSFADLPRTDWQFFGDGKEPLLTVYYLGVPDTTPELLDAAKVGEYLDKRLQ